MSEQGRGTERWNPICKTIFLGLALHFFAEREVYPLALYATKMVPLKDPEALWDAVSKVAFQFHI